MARIEPTPRTTVRRKPGRGAYDRETIEAILDEGFLCNVAVVVEGERREGCVQIESGIVVQNQLFAPASCEFLQSWRVSRV